LIYMVARSHDDGGGTFFRRVVTCHRLVNALNLTASRPIHHQSKVSSLPLDSPSWMGQSNTAYEGYEYDWAFAKFTACISRWDVCLINILVLCG